MFKGMCHVHFGYSRTCLRFTALHVCMHITYVFYLYEGLLICIGKVTVTVGFFIFFQLASTVLIGPWPSLMDFLIQGILYLQIHII
jgi:hypothetical protein